MSLAKLVVHLQANYKSLTSGLKGAQQQIVTFASHLRESFQVITDLQNSNNEMERIGQLPAKNAEIMNLRLVAMGNTLRKLEEQYNSYVASFQAKVISIELRKQAEKAEQIRKLWRGNRSELVRYTDTAKAATREMQQMASVPQRSQSSGMIVSRQQGEQRGGSSLPVLAATVVQIKAVSGLQKAFVTVKQSLTQVKSTMSVMAQSSTVAATAMDRFRLAALAPKTDPSLNVLKNGVEKVGNAAAETINKLRGMADAAIEGIPDTLGQIASSGAQVSAELDKTSATMSKHISRGQTMSRGLKLLSVVFPFAAKAIAPLKQNIDAATAAAERGAQKVESASAIVNSGANKARNAQFVLTGTFQKLGGSADMFARGQYHAMLPARLLKREIEGSMRVVRAATTIWNVATHPVHKLSLAISHSKNEFSTFRATLPPLTGGLQLGARAYRAFAHATYLTSTAMRPLAPLGRMLAPVLTAVGRGTMTAAKSLLTLKGQAQLAATAMNTTTATARRLASAVASVASPSRAASAGMSGMMSTGRMLKAGVAGLAVGMIAMGTNTALGVEKSQAVFGTLLHDMQQGKAVVASLQQTKAAAFFDNDELQRSAALLYKSGVSTVDLAARTDQFAKVAAGASVDIGMLADRYMQGFQKGSFGLGQINDMATEGVAIYAGLEAATGQSGAALQKMIADGQIGIPEMDAALAHLTEGQGLYANSLENLANTTAGKMASIKNNVSQALGQVMGVALEVLSPFASALVTLSEQLKAAFTSFRGPIMFAAAAGAWFFRNIVDLAKFSFAVMALTAVTAFEDIGHWFTATMPAYLSWFADNWANIFTDIYTGTMTVFSNLTSNIANAMSQIWDFIASGGTTDLAFTWTPLLDGFKSTVSQLPDVPDRAMSQLEQSLSSQAQTLGTNLANDFDKSFEAAVATAQPAVELKAATAGKMPGGEDGAKDPAKAQQQDNAPLIKGSKEAATAIFAAMRQKENVAAKIAQQQLAEQKKQRAAAEALNTRLAGSQGIMVLDSLG